MKEKKISSFLLLCLPFSRYIRRYIIYLDASNLPPVSEPCLVLDLSKAKGHTKRKHGPTLLSFRWPLFWTLLILSVKPIQEKQFGLHGGHLNKSTLYSHNDESYYDETHVKISP